MKTLGIALLALLIAGCAGMHRDRSSGASGGMGAGSYQERGYGTQFRSEDPTKDPYFGA